MITAVLAVGRWQTAHSFSLPNRLMPRFGVRRRVFDDESHHPIDLGERFLRRRISGYLDPLLAGRFIPAFFEKICLDHYRRDLSLSGRNAFGAAAEVRPRELLRFSD